MRKTTKKTVFIALAAPVLVAAPAAAVFAADENAPFDGGYLGGGLTLDHFNTGATVDPAATTTLDGEQKLGGGIYGGFGKQMDQLYFGLEGGFYISNPEPTFNFGATSSGLEAKNSFDLSGRVGFVADRTLFYGLGGFTSTKFDTFGLTTNEDKRLSGFRYGGGIEFAFMPQLSLRAEYTRAEYEKWDVTNATDTITFDPNEDRFMIGAAYRF